MAKKKKKESTSLMNVQSLFTGDIKPHPKNARLHDNANLDAIARSLKEFGQRTPIVVWNNLIIKGCGTWEAAKQILGWKKIQALRADDLAEEKALAYAIADNKTTDMSEFDYEMLKQVMSDIGKKDLDLSMTGFQSFELELFGQDVPQLSDEDLPDNLPDTDIKGEGSGMGRFILVYDSDVDKDRIMSLLGIEGKKVVYPVDQIPALGGSQKSPSGSKKKKKKRPVQTTVALDGPIPSKD